MSGIPNLARARSKIRGLAASEVPRILNALLSVYIVLPPEFSSTVRAGAEELYPGLSIWKSSAGLQTSGLGYVPDTN